jgi:hypothetical protein
MGSKNFFSEEQLQAEKIVHQRFKKADKIISALIEKGVLPNMHVSKTIEFNISESQEVQLAKQIFGIITTHLSRLDLCDEEKKKLATVLNHFIQGALWAENKRQLIYFTTVTKKHLVKRKSEDKQQ